MALPKAIQEQANALAVMEQQLTSAPAPGQPATTAEPTQTTADPAPPAADAAPTQAPEPVPAAPLTPAPVARTDDDPNGDTWQQRYRTLQGMFGRETRTLHARVQALEAELAARAEAEKTATAGTTPTTQPSVTQKDSEAFGDDLIDLARRVARDEFSALKSALTNELQQLRAQVGSQVSEVQQSHAQTAGEIFFDRLTQAVPMWEQMQAAPECQEWLGSRVPGLPITWDEALKDAAAKFDVSRAVEVFRAFAAANPKFAPRQPAAPTPTAAATSQVNRELSRQVTPSRAANPAPAPSSDKRAYTSAEFEAESNRVIRLSKAGKFDEAVAIEAELNAAIAEGRVRP